MSDNDVAPPPACELTNERLEQQGTGGQANWVLLPGSGQQRAHPTASKLTPEPEHVGGHRMRAAAAVSSTPTPVVATPNPWRVCGADRARTAGSRS